jgi:hypothetical protein
MTDDAMMKRLDAPASVYLLAEHLDAALAAGEDLTSVLFIWPGPPPRDPERIADLRAGQRAAIERIRTFELALIARILNAGNGLIGYVRSRGMIAADAPGIVDTAPLVAGENFLVARRIPLGALLDLVAQFLDTLEGEYDLFFAYKDGGSAFSLPAALLR